MEALPALEKVMRHHGQDPAWAGWGVRLAHARAAADDEPGARAALAAAAEVMAKHRRLTDLQGDARGALEARDARGLRKALDALVDAVHRRRALGELLP